MKSLDDRQLMIIAKWLGLLPSDALSIHGIFYATHDAGFMEREEAVRRFRTFCEHCGIEKNVVALCRRYETLLWCTLEPSGFIIAGFNNTKDGRQQLVYEVDECLSFAGAMCLAVIRALENNVVFKKVMP